MTIIPAAIRRALPVGLIAAAAVLCIPGQALAAQTANLFGNPSFERGIAGWGGGGASAAARAVPGAPDGANVGVATGWLFQSQISLNSTQHGVDGRVVAGSCTASARARMGSGAARSGHIVLRERNGWGFVVRTLRSPAITLNPQTFQTLTVSGNIAASGGNRLDIGVVVNGVNMWGGESVQVDAANLQCEAIPPLHVHLGDSYSSGAGSETTPTLNGRTVDTSVAARGFLWMPSMIHPCYRTNNNAAQIMAKQIGQRVRDASCAGAKTENILHSQQVGLIPLQINAVTADTDMVTLTIGGNDAALLNILFCGAKADECTVNSPEIKQSYSLLPAMEAGLRNTIKEITRRAPNAVVRFANYPYLLPTPGSPSGACGAGVTQGEMQMGKDLQDAAGAVMRKVGSEFGPKVKFVDVNAPGSPFNAVDEFGTRDFCSVSPNRWMNGAIDLGLNQGIGEIHPNAKGYDYYAQMYMASL